MIAALTGLLPAHRRLGLFVTPALCVGARPGAAEDRSRPAGCPGGRRGARRGDRPEDAVLAQWPGPGGQPLVGRGQVDRAPVQRLTPEGPDVIDTVVAVVHDPGARETFTAVRGGGAALNGEPIHASGCARLAEALVGFSFNPSPQAKRDMAQIISVLLPAVGDIRRVPAALHLAYLAAGRFDAGVLRHTKLWDIAAGLLVAAEAGVVLSGPDGAPTPELTLAAAPALWHEFSEVAAEAIPRPI